ncbi:MAG: addiction module protein [Bacteroidetes bacterium]|nr:MAG: addiction module protein [Bacteroidota bacterium]
MISTGIQKEVLDLIASKKPQLTGLRLKSLDNPDIEIQDKWIEESEKRYDAYKSGRIKAISFEEVLKQFEK